MLTADTISADQIRSVWTDFHNAITGRELMAALREPIRDGHTWTDEEVTAARSKCAALLNECTHATQIETETRGVPVGNGEHHLYHRWTCSCGAAGPWGHSLWAKVSIFSAEKSAQLHVFNARAKEQG